MINFFSLQGVVNFFLTSDTLLPVVHYLAAPTNQLQATFVDVVSENLRQAASKMSKVLNIFSSSPRLL